MITKNKILIVGDMHLRSNLGYSEYVQDGRENEEKEILDFIISSSSDCDKVVFMGDILNSKNSASSVIKKLVEFIERLGNKKLYFLRGNHDGFVDGKSSLDFLNEIKNKNWKVINDVIEEDGLVFCPYFYSAGLSAEDNDAGTKIVMDKLKAVSGEGKILFAHHALTNTKIGNIDTSFFSEILLPRTQVSKMFKKAFLGHLHTSDMSDDSIVYTGSIFNQEMGEVKKYIWKFNGEKTEQIDIPSRGVYKLENPKLEDLEKIPRENIVKCIITNKKINKEEIEKKLKEFDAGIIVERYPNARKKMTKISGDIVDMPIDKLVSLYAKERKVDITKLTRGFDLITT